jgi:hypothetical protein
MKSNNWNFMLWIFHALQMTRMAQAGSEMRLANSHVVPNRAAVEEKAS